MKPTAILTADIELRAFQPTCRTDNHWEAQARKIKWLRELQEKYDCPILDAGDLFDKRYKTNPSHELLGWAMANLPQPLYTVPGNHDLPGKSIANYSNSAMAVLEGAGKLNAVRSPKYAYRFEYIGEKRETFRVWGFPWGAELKDDHDVNQMVSKSVALVHAMVYKEFEPFPGCEGYTAQQVMDLLPGFDLIVTGHNHQTFTHTDGKRLLVNPGSLMRNDADQMDFRPSVFLWYAEANRVRQVFVPIEEGVISREHIDEVKARESRMDAFVEKLGDQAEVGVDFLQNLEAVVDREDVPVEVKDKVWAYVEKEAKRK